MLTKAQIEVSTNGRFALRKYERFSNNFHPSREDLEANGRVASHDRQHLSDPDGYVQLRIRRRSLNR